MTPTGVQGPRKGKPQGICVHDPCTCTVDEDMYCSEACRAGDEGDPADARHLPCACGHPGCAGTAEIATEGRLPA